MIYVISMTEVRAVATSREEAERLLQEVCALEGCDASQGDAYILPVPANAIFQLEDILKNIHYED